MIYRNWAGLPRELLSSIAELLPIPDFFRFSVVCKSWDTAVKDLPPRLSSSCFPWLALIPCIKDDDNDIFPLFDPHNSLVFFNSSENWHYRVSRPESSNISLSRKFLAHRDGWIVFYDDSLELPILLNPITRVHLHLPSFSTLPYVFRRGAKVFLPTSPSNSMLAVLSYKDYHPNFWLAFAKPGDEKWSAILPYTAAGARTIDYGTTITDVQFHDSRFYALCHKGQLITFDLPAAASIDGTPFFSPVSVLGSLDPLMPIMSTAVRLVSVPSTGDLLLVKMGPGCHRPGDFSYWIDVEFDILKFNSETDNWVEVTDLGDQSLFLDWYGALLLSSRDIQGLRANCIYFANPLCHFVAAKKRADPNVQVYEVGNMTVKKFIIPCVEFEPRYCVLRSMWFMPSLMKHIQ